MARTAPEFGPFLAAMTDAPGESTNLFVFADWLDEHDRPELAQEVRVRTPLLLKRYRRAVACQDALLGLDLGCAHPVALPAPDRGNHRSRRQWRAIVRDALKTFKLSDVSVAAAPGWQGGPDVELRLPPADLFICDGSDDGFVVPWGVTSASLLAAGVLAFSALIPRLFPEESPRTAHAGGDSFDTSFWRVVIRSQF